MSSFTLYIHTLFIKSCYNVSWVIGTKPNFDKKEDFFTYLTV